MGNIYRALTKLRKLRECIVNEGSILHHGIIYPGQFFYPVGNRLFGVNERGKSVNYPALSDLDYIVHRR